MIFQDIYTVLKKQDSDLNVGSSLRKVFHQEGMVSTVDGVNIQWPVVKCNRKFTSFNYLWKTYQKSLPVSASNPLIFCLLPINCS